MKLIEIDLTKGNKSNHPDIKKEIQYLAKINKTWFAGFFSKQWYGWNFDGWYGVGIQFDTPGTNKSRWKQLFEIVEE